MSAKADSKIPGLIRFVGRYLPGTATTMLRRKAAFEQLSRSYEAAEKTRARKRKLETRSPDQANQHAGDMLRFQARELDENNDIAKSVLTTVVSNVVGDGLRTSPQVRDTNGDLAKDVNQRISKYLRLWSEAPEVTGEHDWGKVQNLMCRSWFRDGECFSQDVFGAVPGVQHGSSVSFSIELMEADYCPSDYNSPEDRVTQGVRKNAWGRPLEYFFFKTYPSEMSALAMIQSLSAVRGGGELKSVDASRIRHLKLTDRIRQTRGVTVFASVFARLMDIKDYEDSERFAARMGAALALQIKRSPDHMDTQSELDWEELDMVPGLVFQSSNPDEEISTIKNERPNNQLEPFRNSQLRAIAGGTYSGFSDIAKNFEGSYSSQRQELVVQHRIYTPLRREFAAKFIQPTYRSFVDTLRLQGLLDLTGVDMETLYSAQHVGRGMPYIQPLQEIKAKAAKIDARLSSRHREALEDGNDPDDLEAEVLRELKYDKENGFKNDNAQEYTDDQNSTGDD